jgi:hypothetical protein
MDEEEYEIGEEWYSRRFQKVDLVIFGVNVTGGTLAAVAASLEALGNALLGHANYNVDRDSFHEEAALEIETMTTGETD